MADIQLASLNNLPLAARKSTTPTRLTSDGSEGAVWAARDGALITMDWYTAMAMEGRVFNTANASPDTKLTGTVNYTATVPDLCFVAPAGTTMIPVYLTIHAEDMTGTDNHIVVVVDSGDLYTSGGTACAAPTNLRTDSPYSSAIAKYYNGDSAITAVDPGTGETIVDYYFNAFTDATTSPPFVYQWQPKCPPVLVGPATLLVYVYAASTGAEYGFSYQWVELPSNSIV